MGNTYKTLDQINPDLFRGIILGSDSPEVEEGSTQGLMSSRFATRPRARPVDLDTTVATTPASSFLTGFAQGMARSSDDRERLANAVVPRPTPRPADLTDWESMPPLEQTLQGDATRAALGSAEDYPVNLEGSTRGAVPVSQQQASGQSDTWDSTNFADTILRRFEGTEAHKSLEGGAATGAFGVKFSQGLNREDFDSDLAFAAAVAQKHYDMAASSFSSQGRSLSELPVSVQNAIVDIHYNNGTIGSTAEKDTPVDMMRNTLDFIGATTADGTRGSVLSLARRRAENWNSAAADLGVSRISSIEQIPTNGGTEFRYLDADGNVVHRTTTSRTPITFTGGTSYSVNTDTRRVEIE
jgi:hypothetical protein